MRVVRLGNLRGCMRRLNKLRAKKIAQLSYAPPSLAGECFERDSLDASVGSSLYPEIVRLTECNIRGDLFRRQQKLTEHLGE